MKVKFIGALATTALLGGIALSAGEVFAGTSGVTVGYTTKVEISDPENPDSSSYALQLPAGFQFTKENEPLPGRTEGVGTSGVFKLVNPTDNSTYSGTKTVKLSVSSANAWK
ncbi:hypothetical protein [Enterococcus sp. DIV1420a]|uniref:hypothetical protein n=1 Tax=Enterococcus sp. DIV1420a TaxID=2774672 RepID=UPI003F22519B